MHIIDTQFLKGQFMNVMCMHKLKKFRHDQIKFLYK